MLMQGQVGPIGTKISDGGYPNSRLGNSGDLIVSELMGRYYEAAYRNRTFVGANQAPVTTTVGLATTYTGLALTNPIGSGFNLVLKKVGLATIVAFPAGSVIGIMTGYNGGSAVTQTTPLTPKNTFVSGPTGVGLVASAVTMPTAPTVHIVIASGLTGAITTSVTDGRAPFDMEGSIILPPGGYAALYTSTISGTSGLMASFMWDEIPI